MVGVHVSVGRSRERLSENCVRVDVVVEEDMDSAGARFSKEEPGKDVGIGVFLVGRKWVCAVKLVLQPL